MKVPARFRIGTATHTGLVRSGNEDDYLVVAPPDREPVEFAVAIADGMGGVAGGAEASRSALRGFAAGLLDAAPTATGLEAVVGRAYASAWARVREQAELVPALRDMGTTMTVLAFAGQRLVLGHVGDTRAYRLRGGDLRQLSRDHAATEHGNRLLRCIGGGLDETPPDLLELEVEAGDRYLLCSDGVWGTVERARVVEALQRLPAAAAAERLVAGALAAGGPDNGTALVVHVVEAADDAPAVEIPLPVEEAARAHELSVRGRLGAPRWPWLLLVLSVALLAAVLVHAATGFDAFQWLRARW